MVSSELIFGTDWNFLSWGQVICVAVQESGKHWTGSAQRMCMSTQSAPTAMVCLFSYVWWLARLWTSASYLSSIVDSPHLEWSRLKRNGFRQRVIKNFWPYCIMVGVFGPLKVCSSFVMVVFGCIQCKWCLFWFVESICFVNFCYFVFYPLNPLRVRSNI